MNPTAVYSKSGKGVQEASGKTTQLSRGDRAVLTAIDGRASLADVAERVGREFDSSFRQLITQLDRDGFIRQVTAGAAAAGAPKTAGARPVAKPSAPTAPMDPASDLDFTVTLPVRKAAPQPPPQPPPRAPAPPARPANVPPPPPPPTAAEKEKAERIAREQQAAMARAREEAERKSAAERDRLKAAAEAKARAEAEANAKSDAASRAHEAREAAVREAARLAAEAKAKAAEAKAKADAEVKRAKEEAERIRREAEEKIRREQEALKQRLEDERRQLEDERRKLEDERRRVEEQSRKEEAERVARRARDEEEAAAAEIRRTIEQKQTEQPKKPAEAPKPPPAPVKTGDAFADSLLADLDSFNSREEEEERKRRAEDEQREARHAATRREEAERQAKAQAERQANEAKERLREERDRRAREAEEEAAGAKREAEDRMAREEERRKQEEEERKRKAKEEERLAARASHSSSEAYAASVEQKRRKEAQLQATGRTRVAERSRRGWGRTAAVALTLLLLGGVAALHIVPISTAQYERVASRALGRPVKIGSGNFSLFTGVQLKFDNVAVGDARIGRVRAFPELATVLSDRKIFSRIELEGLTIPQESVGEALFTRIGGDGFAVARVVSRDFRLDGPLPLPPLEGELVFGADGALRSATLRGADGLVAKLTPRGGEMDFELSANRFTLPFAQEITFGQFGMKGSATRNAMNIAAWDGQIYSGTLTGTARLRWGGTWNLEGALTARGVNAAVFAPALLSDGRAEGTGRFFMSGPEPAKLGRGGRLEGSFTVNKGALGSFDLSRAIQTGGKQSTGSTRFAEMNGQGVYDRGAIALRNVTIGAGALNAGASADIAQTGALSGRIVADVKTASQTLRATLLLGGTLKEPQVRN
jgi:hypothetical protein